MEPVSNHPDELGLDLASIGSRFGARLIDTAIGFGVWITLFLIVVAASDLDLADPDNDLVIPDGAATILRWAPFILWAAYEVFLTVTRGQTVGKMVTRIKVISASGGELPAWRSAALRWAALALPLAFLPDAFGLGGSLLVGVWFIWDANRQGLHDKSATTYVVKNPVRPAPE